MLAGIQLPERCAVQFKPVRVLASGGFGVAILAEQVSLKRLAVLKVLSRDSPDPADRARFRHEAQITASLNAAAPRSSIWWWTRRRSRSRAGQRARSAQRSLVGRARGLRRHSSGVGRSGSSATWA